MGKVPFYPLWDDSGPALLLFGVMIDEFGATADMYCAFHEIPAGVTLTNEDEDAEFIVTEGIPVSIVGEFLPNMEVTRAR